MLKKDRVVVTEKDLHAISHIWEKRKTIRAYQVMKNGIVTERQQMQCSTNVAWD